MAAKNLEDRLLKIYNQPGHPLAYSNPQRFYKFFNGKIPLKKIEGILRKSQARSLHYKPNKPRIFNPFYVVRLRDQIQCDLIDVSQLSAANKGVNYLFCGIDVFSKMLWCYPLKRKDSDSMLEIFESWFETLVKKPKVIYVDLGKEFWGKKIQNFLATQGVTLSPAYAWSKAGVVERVQRSLQLLLYTYLTENDTLYYLNALPKLVNTYNNRGHRSLGGRSPKYAEQKKHQLEIRQYHMKRYNKIAEKRKKPVFKVGDLVRIKTTSSPISQAARGYTKNFHFEIFVITKISKRMPIAKYHLRSLLDDQEISGSFYREELSLVTGQKFKVDKVLKRKGKGKNRKVFVKYRDVSDKYNEWLYEKDLAAL